MLKDFDYSEQRLAIIEKQVLEARQVGFSLFQIEESEFKAFVCALVFKISAMTGIKLPKELEYIEELEYELGKHLLENTYRELSTEEVHLALRVNLPYPLTALRFPSGIEIDRVEPQGDCVSVEYVSLVLRNYKVIRNAIDRKLQNFIDGIGYNY